ncbi:MAG: hypothetical protein ACRCUY_06245, partial [Thermoguttaceae bacterium]
RREQEMRAKRLRASQSQIKRDSEGKTMIQLPSQRVAARVPEPESFARSFDGGHVPNSVAKWEAEIHQIARQMIGQLDCKMVALQSITAEANRVANRLELLVEHLESLSKLHTRHSKSGDSKQNESMPVDMKETDSEQNNSEHVVNQDSNRSETNESNIISGGKMSQMESFTDLLDDLEAEMDAFTKNVPDVSNIQNTDVDGTNESDNTDQITILKMADNPPPQTNSYDSPHKTGLTGGHRLPPSISLSTGNPLASELVQNSLGPRLPVNSLFESNQKTSTGTPKTVNLSHKMMEPPPPIMVMPPVTMQMPPLPNASANFIEADLPQIDSLETDSPRKLNGSSLQLRQEVEMLADYGYTSKQIAESLTITISEVELMLKLRHV